MHSDLIYFSSIYLILFSISIMVQYRYIFPIYILLCIELAKKNAEDNDIKNIKFEVGDVTGNVGEYKALIKEGGFNVLLLDPPRNGLDKAVEVIMDCEFEKIIYMSCNPLSLVKDLAVLTQKWKIEEVTLWDLYPQTPHVECLVVMKKNI